MKKDSQVQDLLLFEIGEQFDLYWHLQNSELHHVANGAGLFDAAEADLHETNVLMRADTTLKTGTSRQDNK